MFEEHHNPVLLRIKEVVQLEGIDERTLVDEVRNFSVDVIDQFDQEVPISTIRLFSGSVLTQVLESARVFGQRLVQ